MSTRISIPKICQHCGNSFIARTTVTKYCGDNCAKRAYKKRKRDEKIQASIEETKQQMQGLQSPQTMQTQDILTKQYLSVQEAANLLGYGSERKAIRLASTLTTTTREKESMNI